MLSVGGLEDCQQVRPVAFPTVRSGVVPAYEAIVLKARDAFAYKLIIDARTGAVADPGEHRAQPQLGHRRS